MLGTTVPGVTIVHLIHAYVRRNKSSVWIVPGSLDDFEDPSNEGKFPHITDYLLQRGIIIASEVKPDAAAQLVREAIDRFRRAGINAVEETLCDD
jgi:hypothetical protein